jgi:hypothetical protein
MRLVLYRAGWRTVHFGRGLGWLATTGNFKQTMIIGIGAAAALLWAALWLGSLRPQAPEPPSHRASV